MKQNCKVLVRNIDNVIVGVWGPDMAGYPALAGETMYTAYGVDGYTQAVREVREAQKTLPPGLTYDRWYDPKQRTWVVQVKDAAGLIKSRQSAYHVDKEVIKTITAANFDFGLD